MCTHHHTFLSFEVRHGDQGWATLCQLGDSRSAQSLDKRSPKHVIPVNVGLRLNDELPNASDPLRAARTEL